MYRRRPRKQRDIPFSLDSFLDVVANVVGVIIRMILVAWVGARSYDHIAHLKDVLPPDPPPEAKALKLPEKAEFVAAAHVTADPLTAELERRRRELREAQTRLLAQLRQLPPAAEGHEDAARQLATVAARRKALAAERAKLPAAAAAVPAPPDPGEVRLRCERLKGELAALEKLPPRRKVLRYRAPISRPVHTEELLFECRGGKVTYIDIPAFLDEVRGTLADAGKQLRGRWEVQDVTRPVGPFRLRYVIERERERELLGAAGPGVAPERDTTFRYGLTGWEVEPLTPQRGEGLEAALAAGSEFRQVVDAADPRQTVVTFWVYPDSFALYRGLRDFLYDREVEVAGRPVPEGTPIRASRHGTRSRGQ